MASASTPLRAQVREATGQNAFRCYQCGNCSAGCPMAGKGDLLPHQVFRMLQTGDDGVLSSVQPWLCVGCQTCATRCPQELDLSAVMDFLRAAALRAGSVPAEAKRMSLFNRLFVNQVVASGRLSEMELGAFFNLGARSPFENLDALPAMLGRGKVKLTGKKVRGPGEALRRRRAGQ